ncbi:MAG: hypothetical protein D6760_11220 [Deltaproteobacteria bacterium]|nr:MAG: hypothetical protein D6760_11220 [Deltaproteobacteria bacterium]
MSGRRQELSRLLELYRKGVIDEQALIDQMDALGLKVGEDGEEAASQRPAVESLVERLDRYRAAEASGAETLERWAELTGNSRLAGGLRVAAARERAHAQLLERRIGELGGQATAVVPDWLAGFNAALVDPEASDEQRLGAIVKQFPDPDAAVAPLRRFIDSVSGDPMTQSLLLSICDDEQTTVRWFHEEYARITGTGS